jgi:hypothetical protein
MLDNRIDPINIGATFSIIATVGELGQMYKILGRSGWHDIAQINITLPVFSTLSLLWDEVASIGIEWI